MNHTPAWNISKMSQSLHLKRTVLALAVSWTIMIFLLLCWNLREEYLHMLESVHAQALSSIQKDIIYRHWAASHSGVYVPVTEDTPPNPYLSHLENRDVTTTSGIELTLINPAYMTRQTHELRHAEYRHKGHIISLKPIRPGNAPDAWEAEALQAFEQGVTEVVELTKIGDAEYLRLIQPMITEASCLKCHGAQGYKVGAVRGGISVSVPMAPQRTRTNQHMVNVAAIYGLIWLLGLGGITRSRWHIDRRISESEQAEAMLRENEERLRTTLNSLGDAVLATDVNSNVTGLNPAGEKLTGWEFEEAQGKPFTDIFNLVHKQTRKTADNPIEQVLAAGEMTDFGNHTLLVAKDGTEYQVAITTSPIKNTDGTNSGVVLVFQDVTEQNRIEEELFKARKLESVGTLAGGIAHDFNNILTSMFGNIELAKRDLPRDHKAYISLEAATQAFEHATNLTKQLLAFAKGGDPIFETVNIEQIIKIPTEYNLRGSDIKTALNLPDGLWPVKADKGLLSQVIANLTINAKQAMQGGGTLYIDAENINITEESTGHYFSGNFVKLNIRDEGSGISEKHLKRIFDPYFTIRQTGNGLGLTIVHNIITKHNGHISVDSKLGVGTTVTLYLPAETSSPKATDETPLNGSEKSKFAPGHILVMDDEEMIRDFSIDILESWGYTVDSAVDGDEVIDKYSSAKESGHPFDIVIMDLTIPGGMGGQEAVIKLLAVDPKAKVIVSSGYSTDPVLANYIDYGFKGRIVKPFRVEALENEVSRVMALG